MQTPNSWLLSNYQQTTPVRRPPRAKGPQYQPLSFEVCEPRAMLAADIGVAGFEANGEHLRVAYGITGENAAPFTIAIYGTADGSTLGSLLGSVRVENAADLAVGPGHELEIDELFGNLASDQYLLAVADSQGEVAETNEENNQFLFEGGVFRGPGSELHIHGTDAADTVTINGIAALDVQFNAQNYSFTPTEITRIRVWGHGGNDQITFASTLLIPLTAFGGAGNDTITGGAGNDTIYGDAGDDILDGGGGINQVLQGGSNLRPNAAPQIVDFAFTQSGSAYLFTGRVLDDTDPTGYQVTFGGLLVGRFAVVGADDTFSFSIQIDFGIGGEVSCQTIDVGMLLSNMQTVYV